MYCVYVNSQINKELCVSFSTFQYIINQLNQKETNLYIINNLQNKLYSKFLDLEI